ncbi:MULTISPECIES: MFS transporter [Rhizobium]|uniref:MFS transporter n=1 Tax=Rhizobium TaxID=379 RepID=UPI00234FB18D|nr:MULTISPECIES: MFS transporter [unclassified Rhizobium]MDC7743517.1 MFS transporter [Rhizobium sp. BC56]MDC9807877.1 MFS transporter [Rhizobium sp. MC62]MDC9832686.1 MFS transporter [Rhizobium sp. MJ37]WEA26491.1 MFS transporter [Rhizobium sp. MJ22]
MSEPRNRRLFLSVLSAASSYTADISIFPIVLASLSKDFGISSENSVLLAYSYNIALVAGIVPSYFAKNSRVLIALFRGGLVIFSLGALLLVTSNAFSGLLFGRVLMGLGAGVFSPLIPSIISVTFKDKTRYLSYWATTTGVVCVAAPLALIAVAQLFELRSSVALILGLSVVAFSLIAVGSSTGSDEETAPAAGNPTTNSLVGLLSVLGTVFIIYGQLTWLMYAVPLRAARDGFSDTQLALLGACPWIAFTALSYAMRKVRSDYFPRCLIFSAILSGLALVAFAGLPVNSAPGLLGVMFTVGIAMALANIPSTALAFSYVDSSKFGLVSCLDILSARLGGAFYLYQFDWSSRSPSIVLSSVPLVLLLWCTSMPQRKAG